MNKSKIKEELRKEREAAYARKYYLERKNDPEFIQKRLKMNRAYYKKLKKTDPERYERHNKINRENMRKYRMRKKLLAKMEEKTKAKTT